MRNSENTIVDLFKEQARIQPHSVALCFGERSISYRELDQLSNNIASELVEAGIKNETIVPVLLHRSIELITSLLGILKAGGAYMPLEPDLPSNRLLHLIEDAGSSVVVTSSNLADCISNTGKALNILFADKVDVGASPVILTRPSPVDLAYVMFTSGSTGFPKGVMIEHRGIANLVTNVEFDFLNRSTRLLATGAPSFDATTFEYWGTLANGGTLILCPKDAIVDPVALKDLIVSNEVNTMWFTSSLFNLHIDTDPDFVQHIKYIIVGGEKLSSTHIRTARQKCEDLRIINGYGPTENTTFSLCHTVRSIPEHGTIPIGKPLDGRTALLEDDELLVGGCGVARGYLNQPFLTSEKFVWKYPGDHNGERMYRTGDRVRQLPDGGFEFLGRKDSQVKVRGFRIEPGEIEEAIRRSGLVKNVVVAMNQTESNTRIIAYLVPNDHFTASALRQYLINELPDYMIPTLWAFLKALPLTNNGKVDKTALNSVDVVPFHDNETNSSDNVDPVLSGIWKELLQLDYIRETDTFFGLGGNSLMLVKLSIGIRDKYGVELPFSYLFSDPTFVEMEAHLLKGPIAMDSDDGTVSSRNDGYEATISQRVLYVARRFSPNDIFPNSSIVYRVNGRVDRESLAQAVAATIESHVSLKSIFYIENGMVLSRPSSGVSGRMEIVVSEETDIENEIVNLTRPFDFGKSPLIRVYLIDLADGSKYFYIDMPHINSDGITLQLIVEEVVARYNGNFQEEMRLQFPDFVRQQNDYLRSPRFSEDLSYWNNELESLLNKPLFDKMLAQGSGQGISANLNVPSSIAENLESYSRMHKWTKFQVMFATYVLLISRLTGAREVDVRVPVHNRLKQGSEKIVGLLANVVVVRIAIDQGESMSDIVNLCQKKFGEVMNHQSCPFEYILHGKKKNGKGQHQARFGAFFNYHVFKTVHPLGDASLQYYIHGKTREVIPLAIDVYDCGSDFCLRLSSNEYYDGPSLRKIGEDYFELMRSLIGESTPALR